jgi:stage IV sporulation protein FB
MPKIRISLTSLLLIPAVILDPSGTVITTVLAAFVHELGHLITIFAFGIGVKELSVTPYGLEIGTKRQYKSFGEEMAVSLAGCAVNFLCFFAFSRVTGYIKGFSHACLVLGILNALPVLSLDGGEALFAFLSSVTEHRKAVKISRALSFITLVLMWSIAAYIFLFSGYNYSLFIMAVWLFAKIYCG